MTLDNNNSQLILWVATPSSFIIKLQNRAKSTNNLTSLGGQMSRVPASHSGRSGNPKIAGSRLEPASSKPGQVKPKTLKFILVAS